MYSEVYRPRINAGEPGYSEAVASAGGLRDLYRGALPHVAELKARFGLKANEGDDDYEVRL
jgi:hypothetical protein